MPDFIRQLLFEETMEMASISLFAFALPELIFLRIGSVTVAPLRFVAPRAPDGTLTLTEEIKLGDPMSGTLDFGADRWKISSTSATETS